MLWDKLDYNITLTSQYYGIDLTRLVLGSQWQVLVSQERDLVMPLSVDKEAQIIESFTST